MISVHRSESVSHTEIPPFSRSSLKRSFAMRNCVGMVRLTSPPWRLMPPSTSNSRVRIVGVLVFILLLYHNPAAWERPGYNVYKLFTEELRGVGRTRRPRPAACGTYRAPPPSHGRA